MRCAPIYYPIAGGGLDALLQQQSFHSRATQLAVLAIFLIVVLLSAAFAIAAIRSFVKPTNVAVELARDWLKET
jgi:hypothetical protein